MWLGAWGWGLRKKVIVYMNCICHKNIKFRKQREISKLFINCNIIAWNCASRTNPNVQVHMVIIIEKKSEGCKKSYCDKTIPRTITTNPWNCVHAFFVLSSLALYCTMLNSYIIIALIPNNSRPQVLLAYISFASLSAIFDSILYVHNSCS